MSEVLAIGIDLGTSNSAVSAAREGSLESVEIEQILAPGASARRRLLPSALYLPHQAEAAPGSFRLSWHAGEPQGVIGEWARNRGALAPDRLVVSAKSWLSSAQVDREAPFLPWGSEGEAERVSPVEASRRYIEHLWSGARLALDSEECDRAEIVLTVPASFDESARQLTRKAAAEAGLGNALLLEEPQAAFYAWLSEHGESWRNEVQAGDLVLVCDVGGGTADFSLIAVCDRNGALELERISVGEHLLLGGDNMDLALAYALRERLNAQGKAIDEWQFLSLVHSARSAKEALFNPEEQIERFPIAVPSRGRGLLASTISTEIERSFAEQLLVEGFFPLTRFEDLPRLKRASGLAEFGLNFAPDPVLTKHLAAFMQASLRNVLSDEKLKRLVERQIIDSGIKLAPTAVLFNGGVFRGAVFRERILAALRSWFGNEVRELPAANYDLAVSRGAAAYGALVRKGSGIRIRAGLSHSYYIGVESTAPAVPGITPPIKGLCVAAQGAEEGSAFRIGELEFGAVVGEPVEFRFFSSASRAGDRPGQLIENAAGDLSESSSVGLTLESPAERPGTLIPVRLNSRVTELGMLELYLEHQQSGRRWLLEFNIRARDAGR